MNVTNNNSDEKQFNWSILFIISLSSIVTGIYRDGFAALFPFLQRDFNLTRSQLGLHSTFFFLGMVFVSMFSGRLVDLKGSKWGIGFGLLFMSSFILLHSIVPNFLVLLILAVFTGLSVSINLPAASKGIVEWFPRKWRTTALGIRSTAFPFGGILGAIILPILGSLMGWQRALLFPGIIGLLCALLILFFYQSKSKGNNTENKPDNLSFWEVFIQLIKNKNLVSALIFGIFLAATNGSIVAHFTLYLYLDWGFTESMAGLGFAVLQLGSILGRLGWGLLCDRFLKADKRKTFLYMGISFTFLSLILGLFLKSFNPPIIILFLLAFIAGYSGRGWQGLYIAYITETVDEEYIGIAVGFSTLGIRPGMILAPPIFGYIADLRGSYDLSWLLLGLMMFLASVGQYLFYLKTQHKKYRLNKLSK